MLANKKKNVNHRNQPDTQSPNIVHAMETDNLFAGTGRGINRKLIKKKKRRTAPEELEATRAGGS